jgi:uncharacterized repeat protein (TIGR03803 family)
MASQGGNSGNGLSGNGTVFELNSDGTAFTNLFNFVTFGYPKGDLTLSANTLYGVTWENGGYVFKVNTNGTGFTTLHTFTGTDPNTGTNTDGVFPEAGLILSGTTLFGTASHGGDSNSGTVFKVNTDGTDFTTLHSFSGLNYLTNSDGNVPYSGLVLSGATLYGTTIFGGSGGSGTIFSISLPPQLTITPIGPNISLSWPTNFTGFTLQSTTNLTSPIWTTNLPAPVIVNWLNTVTNPISGTQQLFRLSQ